MNSRETLIRQTACFVLSTITFVLAGNSAFAQLKPGITVEQAAKNSQGEKAGVQAGDVLLSWSRGDAGGEIESPFDLILLEMEQAPRSTLTLRGTHGTKEATWTPGPGAWGLKARPNLSPDLLALYQQGQDLAKTDNRTQAAEQWHAKVAHLESSAPAWMRPWLLSQAADAFAQAHQWKDADDTYQQAVQESAGISAAIRALLFRTWAKTYQQRSDWTNAEKYYQQSISENQEPAAESLVAAADLDDLGTVSRNRGDLDKAEEYYRRALTIRQKLAPESLDTASSISNLGTITWYRGDLAKAEEYYRHALDLRKKLAPGSIDVAASFNNLGILEGRRGDMAKAEEYLLQALEIRKRLDPESSGVASTLNNLALVNRYRKELTKAEEYQRQALDLDQKLAPGSLDVATDLNNLGIIAEARGDLASAEDYHHRALDVRQKLAPESMDVAMSFNNLGNVAMLRGDLTRAEQFHQKAFTLRQKLAPDSLDAAFSLNNLGVVARQAGDLAKAERYQRQALAIRQKLAPESMDVAFGFNNLGSIAFDRGDLAKAEDYHRQALALLQKLVPESLIVGTSLKNLGDVAQNRGDLVSAEKYYQHAFDIRQKLAPGGLDLATSLMNLGEIAEQRGDLDTAEKYYAQALEIQQKLAPGSMDVAFTLANLGSVADRRANLEKAEKYYRQALEIKHNVAPLSAYHAGGLADLAGILRREGKLDEAEPLYHDALDVLEKQMATLGGTEVTRSNFRAQHAEYYKAYVDLLIAQGKNDLAFQVLDHSRARGLIEMLAAAHIDIHQGVDPALLMQERSLAADIRAKSNRRVQLLSGEHTNEQIAAVDQEISKLLAQQDDVEGQIRANSPAYASLTQPQALTLKEVQGLLDHETILLEYSTGRERSHVFAITSELLQAYELPKEADIDAAAKGVYDLLTAPNQKIKGETATRRERRLAQASARYPAAAAQLSQMILAPLALQTGKNRLLIVCDGSLQYVPFSLLPIPAEWRAASKKQDTPATPLIAEYEIVALPSASTLVALRQQTAGRVEAHKAVAVLADPVFDAKDERVLAENRGRIHGRQESELRGSKRTEEATLEDASAEQLTRSITDLGLGDELHLPRLPFTRREAAAILAAVPPNQGMGALDFKASRQTAVSAELGQYRIVHFATHGLLDNDHPELSGLVFSMVDEQGKLQNGYLDLQDVYNLNLPANLVVLSACETGLGKAISGEGLIGLTRGFMYAGATRVIASMWSVDDVATAELMGQLYRAMEKDGLSPAAALRRAQVEMWKQPRWRSPYIWAAFQIQGEWK